MCTSFQTVGNFLAGILHLKKKNEKKKMNESPEFFSGPFSTFCFCQHIHMSDVSVQRQDTELQVFFA